MKYLFIACSLLIMCSCNAQKGGNEKTENQWVYLFNGKDLADWKVKITGHELNDNFASTFRVEDSLLKVRYDGYEAFNEQYGHIFYKKPFSAYLLSVEYRFVDEQVKGGPGWAWRNSGAMLHCQAPESMWKDQNFPISIEQQFLGGDGKNERSTANLCTPGTQVVMGGELYTAHCANSNSKTYHGDQWVRVEALVLGDSIIKHIVNGDTVMTYQKPQMGGGSVANFDKSLMKEGQLLNKGYIALQSESHPIDFREVKLFNLEPYMNDPEKLKVVLDKLRKEER